MPRIPTTSYPGPYDPRLAMLQWEMDRYVERHYHELTPPPKPIEVDGKPAKTGAGSLRNRILVALAPAIAIGIIIANHFLGRFLIDL